MIYLDNAATSFPKPRSVWEEQRRCMQTYCGNPGRSSHKLSVAAAEKIYECREEAASLFGCSHPENVLFTLNATHALNLAIKGLLCEGDHVLFSDLEHNAVVRPLYKEALTKRITFDVFPSFATRADRTPEMVCAGILERILPQTRMLICTHVSNVCACTLPLWEIGALCRERGILFVVDASQSAGHLPIDMEGMRIDALCLPGHKGLWGPQGTGLLLLGEGISPQTLMEGGSGYNSLSPEMPEEAPERYEAGTLPTPAIAGLCEGIRYIKRIGMDRLHTQAAALCTRLKAHLEEMEDVTVYVPHCVGTVLLFSSQRHTADALGEELDARGICVRTGYHCAPVAHKTLGTPEGGAIRVSTSAFNTHAEIDTLADVLRALCRR